MTSKDPYKISEVYLKCNNLFTMVKRFFLRLERDQNKIRKNVLICNIKHLLRWYLLETSKSITNPPKTNLKLLNFIQIIGCLDIHFLSSFIYLFIIGCLFISHLLLSIHLFFIYLLTWLCASMIERDKKNVSINIKVRADMTKVYTIFDTD